MDYVRKSEEKLKVIEDRLPDESATPETLAMKAIAYAILGVAERIDKLGGHHG